ncbi:MAG: flagellar hook-length control protein FliK [Burkholderiaceae bacterium]
MLTINPTALRTAANDTAPFAPPNGADPAGFASLLRQTQTQAAVAVPPAAEAVPALAASTPAQPAPVAHDEASSEPPPPQEPQEPDPAGHARALLRSKLRGADGTGSAPHGPKTDPSTRDTAKAGTTDTAPADKRADAAPASTSSADPALGPSVMHWLASLQQAAAAGGDAGTATGSSGARTDPDAAQAALGDDPGGRVRGQAAGPSAADLKADADLKDAAATQARSQGADPSTAGLFAQALAEQRPIEKAPAPSTGSGGGAKDIAALNAAALAPAPGAAAEVAATAPVVLSTPVTAPDFAQELGLRLSVLARDGVQHAEIHLNPAEMGPVSVQIVMDGTQAHVAFGADAAATRQAIEAGLPDLASALRDAGFTLAGGGVSQHAGGRGDGGDSGARSDSGRRTGDAPDAAQRVGAAARRIVTAGGVDLYA